MPINPDNWRIIPIDVVKEMMETYSISVGELLYMIAHEELSENMAETLERLLENSN